MENKEFSFDCNMSEEYKNYISHDEWGCAVLWENGKGAEYNFCIDGTNCSAIYKVEMVGDDVETDYSEYVHYEIDFSNPEWEAALCEAMRKALRTFEARELLKAVENLRGAWIIAHAAFDNCTNINVNDIILGNEEDGTAYPFTASFDEINVIGWLDGIIENIREEQ